LPGVAPAGPGSRGPVRRPFRGSLFRRLCARELFPGPPQRTAQRSLAPGRIVAANWPMRSSPRSSRWSICSAAHQGASSTAGHHRPADDRSLLRTVRRANRWRHRRIADRADQLPYAQRALHAGDAADHPRLFADVGLLGSRMTAQIVDDLTDTPSHRQREMKGQEVANSSPASSAAWAACDLRAIACRTSAELRAVHRRHACGMAPLRPPAATRRPRPKPVPSQSLCLFWRLRQSRDMQRTGASAKARHCRVSLRTSPRINGV